MTDKTTLGDRMKQYEATTQAHLLRRTPVLIRVDGRAFHTFTKCLPKFDEGLKNDPFSALMHKTMSRTAVALLNGIQNAVFVYTQSDEISILLRDWDKHETQQWFGGNIQKIVSLSASIATMSFNYDFRKEVGVSDIDWDYQATFDSRAYNVPKEEVVNYFIWRQQDASRNSVQMLGRHYYSHKEMHGKTNNEVQDMLMLQKGVNWNDLDVWKKRGTAVYKKKGMSFMGVRNLEGIITDLNIPIFTQNRLFIEQHLHAPIDDGVDVDTIVAESQPDVEM